MSEEDERKAFEEWLGYAPSRAFGGLYYAEADVQLAWAAFKARASLSQAGTEPRGCPTPGACSCIEPAAQAGEPVAWQWRFRLANSAHAGWSDWAVGKAPQLVDGYEIEKRLLYATPPAAPASEVFAIHEQYALEDAIRYLRGEESINDATIGFSAQDLIFGAEQLEKLLSASITDTSKEDSHE
ncbi:hypothetical protein [Azorhizobium caulinodans]|uniref:hypothetical protein n=1 Tax=Azorhizobium caulinodans TaxID=7 RepID=UPI002FBE3E12